MEDFQKMIWNMNHQYPYRRENAIKRLSGKIKRNIFLFVIRIVFSITKKI